MELSVSIGGPLAVPAAIRPANPELINHKWARGLRSQLRFCHRLPSSACLMMLNRQCSNGTNHKVCRVLQAVSPVQKIPRKGWYDLEIFMFLCEDGVIKIRLSSQSRQAHVWLKCNCRVFRTW